MSMLKRICRNFNKIYINMTLKNKLIIFFMTIISFISLILGGYSYLVSSKSLKEQMTSVNVKDIKQIGSNIDFLQKDVIDLSTFICLNPLVQSYVKTEEVSNDNQNFTKYGLEPLNILLASKDYISFMAIYGDLGANYYLSKDGSTGLKPYDKFKEDDIYNLAHKMKGQPVWFKLKSGDTPFISDNKNNKIAMVRTIIDTNTLKECGLMVICINSSTIENMYAQELKVSSNSVLILDSNNNLIALNDPYNVMDSPESLNSIIPYIKSASGYNTVKLKGSNYIATFDNITNSNWKIISLTPEKEIFKNLHSIMELTFGVILGCFIISFLLSIFLSTRLTLPLKELLASMRLVKKGNFKEKVTFKYKDEFGMLVLEYNDMIDNIQTLINSVYKLQLKEKEAELKALQAQINPHFLYNTLDMIFWKAEKSKQTEISDMVYALSKLFRITLSNGREFISVKEEADFIENYLLLQGKRYRDKLKYKINFSDKILNYSIPKLIIQPFVENSIIHGTEEDNDRSLIIISGELVEDFIVFQIIDNGKGMDNKTINNLLSLERIDELSTKNGYAIRNVNQRLSLYYGDNYTLIITSELNLGTTVTISIPLNKSINK
ncbi:sensor histidine kinase [Clostridium sp. 'White wine YQ']|uniref:sensor histidine kinase n=1 Tax=Clostridium sp. 'White wine YQ' TaxID=3027474 RepID=UPI002365AA5D|nr:sensor histidine kinase [Clostridium sp. 'White wine YQ']MDD7795804.1 sensor histidine kinase [Clostridium sp. 'White wine YQ']